MFLGEYMHSAIKIKEFAQLCGTTKDTLLHYDEIDLLKAQRDNYGRRLYKNEQFFDFEVIQILKTAGTSLSDIKSVFNEKRLDKLEAFFSQKLIDLKEEERLLKLRNKYLIDLIDSIKTIQNSQINKVTFSLFDWECLDFEPLKNISKDLPSPEEYIRFSQKSSRRQVQGPTQIGLAIHSNEFFHSNYQPFAFVKHIRHPANTSLVPVVELISTASMENSRLDLENCRQLMDSERIRIKDPVVVWEIAPFIGPLEHSERYVRLVARRSC